MLCLPFGTFFVRVCNVAALFFLVYQYGFIGDQNMAAAAIGRIIIFGAFGLFVCPPWFLMSYCRYWVYYPGMYYIFYCFESVTGRTHLHRHYRTFLG